MPSYIEENEIYKLFNARGVAQLHVGDIDVLPRVEAKEVVHGRWDGKEGPYQGKCSICGYMTYDRTADWARSYWHYCPNCGAKMDLEE